jgi:deoxyribodipyrimidine photo-lyase
MVRDRGDSSTAGAGPAPAGNARAACALVWLRRDLRLDDNAAIAQALTLAETVHCVFVYDRNILDPLPNADRRVEFIVGSVDALADTLASFGAGLNRIAGDPVARIPGLAARLGAAIVVCANDYEPEAVARDDAVAVALTHDGRRLVRVKDQVIFERDEVLTRQGRPYTVYTPYANAWLSQLGPSDFRQLSSRPRSREDCRLAAATADERPTLAGLGFKRTNLLELGLEPGEAGAARRHDRFAARIDDYQRQRDLPAVRGGSFHAIDLRFGTLSIRAAVRFALEHGALLAGERTRSGAGTWLGELIWRDFFFQVLHHFPRVVDHAFRPAFDRIPWHDDRSRFEAWREGRTGYPIVDAAMRQLARTGFMHNRLRMVVASFLTKDLGIDWRLGERYFALALNDYDLAANNGNWQWAASTGCDAQPWFRIFNPVRQSERFDPEGRFIRHYLPQLARLADGDLHAPWLAGPVRLAAAGVILGRDYPEPIVDHEAARREALERYGMVGRQAATK